MGLKARGGKAYLVGAGPGDPGLITLRAIECLQMADVVIHDRLINHSLLAYAQRAELIDVGKESNHHPIPQSQINALIIEHAQAGKTVIRLKGGDPFVFGRGGEEALALAEAGIPFEVVPGITSAVAVPAYAGIPITHRGQAASVAIITGHQADCKKNASTDPNTLWKRLAGRADTLVFLMGVTNLACIVQDLIESGLSPQTPVALIEQGTCPDQKTITGCLENICKLAADIQPPAVIVVGEVVELRETIRWFDSPANRPLLGKRIFHLQPAPSTGGPDEFSRRLTSLGAEALVLPAVQIQPARCSELDRAIQQIAEGDSPDRGQPGWEWILFPNEISVTAFFQCLVTMGYDTRRLHRCQIAALGDAVVSALKRQGVNADLQIVTSSALGKNAIQDLRGKRILIPACPDEHINLMRGLQEQGATLKVVEAYTFLPKKLDHIPDLQALRAGDIDGIVFFHPSEVHVLADLLVECTGSSLPEVLAKGMVACATPAAAEAARSLGVRVDLLAESEALDSLCSGLGRLFREVQEEN